MRMLLLMLMLMLLLMLLMAVDNSKRLTNIVQGEVQLLQQRQVTQPRATPCPLSYALHPAP